MVIIATEQESERLLADFRRRLASAGIRPGEATPDQVHTALAGAVLAERAGAWRESRERHLAGRRACYFSAEFLMGRMVYHNLMCLGLLDPVERLLEREGVNVAGLERVEDDALGNGGLGRLAACFLDSAATLDLPLDGYGIRYRCGLFRQRIEDGFQREEADDWMRGGAPWSVRRESETVIVAFADQTVRAVPYDMPVFGYGTDHVATLRLWQAEPIEPFDFALFNAQEYDAAVAAKNRAEDISRVLYPNDSTEQGRLLRLRQEYFFCAASLSDLLQKFRARHPGDMARFGDFHAVQLNDTHPVIAIAELIRLLEAEGMSFEEAFAVAGRTFSYTNHTIMSEALERWPLALLRKLLPEIAQIIERIDRRLADEPDGSAGEDMAIIAGGEVHMARLAVYVCHHTNGVARIHTDILKADLFAPWYRRTPERFVNETNGITQRRWLGLANPPLAALVTKLLGSESWMRDLTQLEKLVPFAEDEETLRAFRAVKREARLRLAAYAARRDGIALDADTVFDVQIKRIHEYKRQLMNALGLLMLYFDLSEGGHPDFPPTTFLFAGKAAPGYTRAKAVIKLVNEISRMIAADPAVRDRLQVVFLPGYDVSYAEKIVAAADVSEQISTAGTEASGTGNMKLMLNGAVTLGTYDGATVEIVREAGRENNYIFGATVEDIAALRGHYDPAAFCRENPAVARALAALTDGTLSDGGTGLFAELAHALLEGDAFSPPDRYFVLYDLPDYLRARFRVAEDLADPAGFARKGFLNLCRAGHFSSDRTVEGYAREIWRIAPLPGK